MKKLVTFFLLILSLFCFGMGEKASESDKNSPDSRKISQINNTDNAIDVIVKGMTCAICANGIEQKLKENKTVKSIHVDFDAHLVTIFVSNKNELSNSAIINAVTWAGYQVVSINRHDSL
tara:strand:+ start:892 stop:1251 length:360 start_codon:yes stop_codon:yes gene_type:complete